MKKYTSKQEYTAFYWDGSNIEALQEWLNKIEVSGSIWVDSFGRRPPRSWFLNKDGERQGVLTKHPEWVVVSTTFDATVDVHDVEVFNKFFVEVSE